MRQAGVRRWGWMGAAFCAGGALAGVALADAPQMAMQGEVAFFCGGVGADARRAMDPLKAQANLELLFVTEKRGGYLADIALVVETDKGAKLLQTVSEGPRCLLRLPAGRYVARGTYGGTTRVATVRVAAASPPPRVALAFPGEKWDGIWASDEEKQSARMP